jgi:hypothetical protein
MATSLPGSGRTRDSGVNGNDPAGWLVPSMHKIASQNMKLCIA